MQLKSSFTCLEKGRKTETTTSSGFRAVFPKPTKKSWFSGTWRRPGGFTHTRHQKKPPTSSGRWWNAPLTEITLTLLLPAAKTGFRSELGIALTMFPPRDSRGKKQ